ncbi:MAG: type II secretion system protein [Candidatus Shapirobacteria bacterium]
MIKKNFQKGQTLVEIVFLIGITLIILSGLVVAAIFSVKASRYSKNKAIAARLTREQIEMVKAEKKSASFWEDENLNLDSLLDCSLDSLPEAFGCEYIFTDLEEEDSRRQVRMRVIVWWDSASAPDNWWELEEGGVEKKNNVILTTIISNWEQ